MPSENSSGNLFVRTESNLSGKLIKNEKLIAESLTDNTHVVGQTIEEKTLIGSGSDENFIQNELYVDGNDVEELHKKLNTICRFCLIQNDNLRTIFDEYNCISDMFFVFASIQFTRNDGLPEQICCDCLTQLTKCVNFKQQVETAEAVLKHFIEEGYKNGMILEKLEGHNLEKYAEIHANQFSLEFIGDNNDEFTENDFNDTEYYEDYNMDDPQTFPIIQTKLLIAEITAIEPENNNQNELILGVTNENNKHGTTTDEQTVIEEENQINEFHQSRCSDESVDDDSNVTFEISNIDSGVNNINVENNTLWTCSICNKNLKSNLALKRHFAGHSQDKPKEVRRNSVFMKNEQLKNSFQCDSCKASFNIKEDLYIHGSIHVTADVNDGEFVCRKCEKRFANVPKLKRHVRIHFEDKPYKCENCGRGFPEMCSLKRHHRKNHSGKKKEKKYICKFCDKKYYEAYALMVHTRTHTAEKPHICETCDRGFTDIRLLNSHRKTHLGFKTHGCKHCDRKFTHQSTLTTHLRTHTGEKPYVCVICNKYFIQSSNLTLHMRVHSGEKPYTCDSCSKSFASSSALTIHKRTHTGEKPYNCPHCEKCFNRSDLTSHILTHTNNKDKSIKLCDKSFATSSQLKIHTKKHTDKLFTCEICYVICSNEANLKKHSKIHDEEPINDNKCDTDQLDQTKIPIENENIFDTNNSNYQIDNNDDIPVFGTNIIEEDDDNDPELNESISLVNDLLAAVAESDLNSDII